MRSLRIAIPLTILLIVSLLIGTSRCTREGIDYSAALAEALEMLGISEEEFSFEGCLSEADILTLQFVQGESCCLIQDSEGYGTETRFFLAGENIEDTVDLEDLVRDYELPDYQWEELADSLLSEEVTVSPDVTDVVSPEEAEDICNELRKQIEELENKEAEMRSKRDELEGKLSAAKIEREKLETEKADLEAKKASCPDDIAALQNEIPAVEGRIETMQESLRQSVGLWQDCKSRHPSATDRCKGWLDGVGVVYKKLQDLRRQLAVKREGLDRLQQECVDLDSRIHLSITPKLSQLNNAMQDYERDIADLSAQIAELKSKIEQIKQRYADCIDEAEELKKREERVEAARRQADSAVDRAERKVNELEKRYKEFRERFPDGIYPGDVEEYREKIEEIRRKIDAAASELDEDKTDGAKAEARELEDEVEREKNRLGKYWLANIWLENCYKAYLLCKEMLEKRRDSCGSSEYFSEAERALEKLQECCDQARDELVNASDDDLLNAGRTAYDCLHKARLWKPVHEALKKACCDALAITSPDAPGGEEDLTGVEELVDNVGLQAIGELGEVPAGIVRAVELGTLIGGQQKNACRALIMMKFMLTSSSYFEAAVYAYEFNRVWIEISGLPEIPTVTTSAALGLAQVVENIPQETRKAAVDAIDAVLRSARCAGVGCD